MPARLTGLLACPLAGCGGALEAPDEGGPLLACRVCGALYPILADVPILTPSPGEYLATYRESVLASLAERGLADARAAEVVYAFAEAFRGCAPRRFGDDWLPEELSGDPSLPTPPEGPGSGAFHAFLEIARHSGPTEALLDALDEHLDGTVVELGPGAGPLTRPLAGRAGRLLVADLSLRAVLASRAAVEEREVAGIVADLHALPLADGSVDVVVAANIAARLEDAEAFFDEAARVLAPGGRLALTTPDPGLGLPLADDQALESCMGEVGLEIFAACDGIPWVRAHGPRRYEVAFARCVVGRRV